MTKKQRTRAEREARMNRWIIIGAVAVGILVVGVLVYGYLAEVVFKAREPVATANGVPISTADFEARVRYQRLMLQRQRDFYTAQRMSLDPTDPNATFLLEYLNEQIRQLDAQLSSSYATLLGKEVLDAMIQGELVRQEAARRGIIISQEEIDRAIEEQFGYDRDATAALLTPTPPIPSETPLTATPSITPLPREEFENRYRDFVNSVLKPSGLSEAKFRGMVEVSLLYEKLQQAMAAELPATMEQLQIRYIAFPSQEDAAGVVERLDKGEKWEDIAAELEIDGASGAYASDSQWVTRGFMVDQFGEEIAAQVFEMPLQGYTRPLVTTAGRWYIIQLLDRQERELDTFMRSYEEQRSFQEWLNAQMANVQYSENWSEKVPKTP
jgi:foldase protein PrsA